MDWFFNIFGLIGGIFGLYAYTRIDILEKKLKSLGHLPEDFSSEDE